MGMIRLNNDDMYPPLRKLTPQERFEFACLLAQALPDVKVCTIVGDTPDETVILDGHILHRKGAAVF